MYWKSAFPDDDDDDEDDDDDDDDDDDSTVWTQIMRRLWRKCFLMSCIKRNNAGKSIL